MIFSRVGSGARPEVCSGWGWSGSTGSIANPGAGGVCSLFHRARSWSCGKDAAKMTLDLHETTSLRLRSLINAFQGRRVLVIGDMVADQYLIGRPARISRE